MCNTLKTLVLGYVNGFHCCNNCRFSISFNKLYNLFVSVAARFAHDLLAHRPSPEDRHLQEERRPSHG